MPTDVCPVTPALLEAVLRQIPGLADAGVGSGILWTPDRVYLLPEGVSVAVDDPSHLHARESSSLHRDRIRPKGRARLRSRTEA